VIGIQAANLGKAYRIYKRPIDSLKELILRRSFHDDFWALSGIDFTLPQGGSLGIIGENGAGKSTLLKLLAGTIKPTEGRLERNGRVSAILELGSGFHPELTGEDNIRLGCSVLGLSPSETESIFPEIVDFSELGDFVKRPVKTYSSGMYVRLGFSIVTSVNPDVLVVDEALAVGDQHFQKKCMNRMNAFRDAGKTLVFSSHGLYFVKQLCEQTLWLKGGKTEMLGPTMEVTECYQDYQRGLDGKSKSGNPPPHAADRAKTFIGEVTLGGDCVDGTIDSNGRFEIAMTARLEPAARGKAHLGFKITRNDGVWCYGVTTQLDRETLRHIEGDLFGIKFVVDRLPLLAGEYGVDVYLLDATGVYRLDRAPGAASFRVRQHTNEVGVARLPHRWEDP
jgi:lipopolysaccharide transport system ATP-binding protein